MGELLDIAISTLTDFWFWLPIIFAMYSLFQLYLMFFVHPLSLGILPAVVIIFHYSLDRRRKEALFQALKRGDKKFSDLTVQEYEEMIKRFNKEKNTRGKRRVKKSRRN